MKCMGKYNLEELLHEGNGITKISNVLPHFVADGVLAQLERAKHWNDTSATRDYANNNISHSFLSTKEAGKNSESESNPRTMISLNLIRGTEYCGVDRACDLPSFTG